MLLTVFISKFFLLLGEFIDTVLIPLHFFVIYIFICLNCESFFQGFGGIIGEIIHFFLNIFNCLLEVRINVFKSVFYMFLHLSLGVSYETNLFTSILPEKSCVLAIVFSLIDLTLLITVKKYVEFVFCLLQFGIERISVELFIKTIPVF